MRAGIERLSRIHYEGENRPREMGHADFRRPDRVSKDQMRTLQNLHEGYARQSSTTLSGGESQRLKIARELRKTSTGNTLYILDEPTTGLHMYDIKFLLQVLQRLVDKGNTVIIIEHNMDIIKSVDYIIDLGPEGGEKGGTIVTKGTPEQILDSKTSFTAKYLKKYLVNS